MNIVAIDKNLHKVWKVKTNDLNSTRSMHLCPALAQEYPLLAAEFPIVFIKDVKKGSMHSVAMLGLKPKQNVFLHEGSWQARYVPASLRAQPFVVTPIPNQEGQAAVCIDADSHLVLKDDSQKGEALFDEQGNQSKFLLQINELLSSVVAQSQYTDKMIKFFEEKQLFEEQSINVKLKDGTHHRLTQIYRISEKKLNQVSDDDYLEMRRAGYIPAIYAHLLSFGQVNNLVRLYRPDSAADVH